MIGIDTNLLVYAHRSGAPQHRTARAAIERASLHPRGWGIALPSIAEFLAVVTHPSSAEGPSDPSQARRFIEVLLESGQGLIWQPRPDFGNRLAEAVAAIGLHGPRIFDLQIAMIAQENGARQLWTHDRGFVTTPGLRVIDPLSPAK